MDREHLLILASAVFIDLTYFEQTAESSPTRV
jgi:hypothetical protein